MMLSKLVLSSALAATMCLSGLVAADAEDANARARINETANSKTPLTEVEKNQLHSIFDKLCADAEPTAEALKESPKAHTIWLAVATLHARKQLREIGPRIIPELVDGLSDRRPPVGKCCALMLSDFHAADRVIEAMASGKVPAGNDNAMTSLSDMGESVIPMLEPLITSTNTRLRADGLLVVLLIWRKPTVGKPYDLLDSGVMTADITHSIARAIADKNPSIRGMAIMTLAAAKSVDQPTVTKIENSFRHDPGVQVRESCAFTIGHFAIKQHEEQSKKLAKILAYGLRHDRNAKVQALSATSLGWVRNHPEIAVPALTEGLQSLQSNVVDECISSIGNFGEAGSIAIPNLLTLIGKDPKSERMLTVVHAFQSMGPAAAPAVPTLVQIAQKAPDQSLQEELAAAFGAIGPAASPAVPFLTQILKNDNDLKLRTAADSALNKIKGNHRRVLQFDGSPSILHLPSLI